MVDLHLHLDGSLSVSEVIRFAQKEGIKLPTYDETSLTAYMKVDEDCTNLGEYLSKFDFPLMVLQTEEAIEEAVYGLLGRLDKQGLVYAEIRFAPQLHLQKGLTQNEVVKAAVRGLDRANKDFEIKGNLILCCMRFDNNEAENLETVKVASEYFGKGVVAIDLAGNEAAFPTDTFKDVFDYAKSEGVTAIIHAGEAAGAESVKQALELGAKRIGHGVHSVEDEEVVNSLCDGKIPLELCYTSNLQTMAVNDKSNYPLSFFVNSGIVVTINTDDMTVSDTNLKKEYLLLKKQFGYDNEYLKKICINGINSAFISDEMKKGLREKVLENFEVWINS
ncbi:MAG: adenosine deaminase [Lachnospiraceae bacterium]|nr:adenosine deaminase [Lachnospiraceae bacterium]